MHILVLMLATAVSLQVFSGEADAVVPPYVISDDPAGGDCALIGAWDSGLKKCTLSTDISLSSGILATPNIIEVAGNGITIDGAGHTISGLGQTGTGVSVYGYSTAVIMNIDFVDLYYGVDTLGSSAAQIYKNTFTDCLTGVFLETGSNANLLNFNEFSGGNEGLKALNSSNHVISQNDFFTGNFYLYLENSDNNAIFNNNFLGAGGAPYIQPDSTGNVFNFPAPTGGNYWENHARESQGCINADNDRYCDGPYAITGGTDNLPLARRRFLFSWYDSSSPGAKNWVLMANPGDVSSSDSFFDLYINQVQRAITALPGSAPGEVPVLKSVTPIYPGVIGGPVEVGYHGPALVSQRTLWAGNSLEEVVGADASELSSHYWWTWYDQQSAGYRNWVLVSNPGSTTVYFRIKIGGQERTPTNGQPAAGALASGQSVTPQFAGIMAGPVEVEAWSDGVGGTTPAPVYASQRVLSNGGTAFNEVPGITDGDLSSHYVWSWYDEKSPGAKNWILVGNPDPVQWMDVQYRVAGEGTFLGSVPPGGIVVRRGFTDDGGQLLQGGPVEVKTFVWNTSTPMDSIASQRITWGPSFEEVPGQPFSAVGNDYLWTWYDQQSAGMTNWVLVASPPGSFAVAAYQIVIGGVAMDLDPGTAGQQGGFVYPDRVEFHSFPGVIGGPVAVDADNPVISTQRVVYNGFFNEVTGTPPQP